MRRQQLTVEDWDHQGKAFQLGIRTVPNTNQHQLTLHRQVGTHASKEGEIREIAAIQQTVLILRDPIADLLGGADLRGGTFQGFDLIELADRHGMLDPVEELLVGNDPNCRRD